MSYTNILYKIENKICFITINRPDKLNALNMQTIAELNTAFSSANDDELVRVIILTGSGEKAFRQRVRDEDMPDRAFANQEG